MAQIDATQLSGSFDASDPASVTFNPGTGTAFSYSWDTNSGGGGNIVTAFGFAGDFNASTPSGTVNAITIVDSGFNPLISVSGLDVPLADLIDTASAQTHNEKFWAAVLAGDTTIYAPATGASLDIFGDFAFVPDAAVLDGGNDHFIGDGIGNTPGNYIGDAVLIDQGGTLNGGDDVFTNIAGTIYGDVYNPQSGLGLVGTLFGGNDTVSLIDPTTESSLSNLSGITVYGDTRSVASGGSVQGGHDDVTIRGTFSVGVIHLDVDDVEGSLIGGNDTLLVEMLVEGRSFTSMSVVYGDADFAGLASSDPVTTTITGGDDAITLRNVNSGPIFGDISSVTNRSLTGGNDTIFVESTFTPAPNPSFQTTGSVAAIYGDFNSFTASAGEVFTGGDDVITAINTTTNVIHGDGSSQVGDDTQFFGGNDTIHVIFNRETIGYSSPVTGDVAFAEANFARFGDDTIIYDMRGSLTAGTVLYGDVGTYSDGQQNGGDIVFGNDTVTVLANQSYDVTIYGDAENFTLSGFATIVFGDDILTGGAGDDTLWGDVENASIGITPGSSITGGDDILDGGLGNDILEGGGGTNTASFASVDRAVFVMLDGIPGTGSTSADFIHAIGQGFDTLRGIDNVTGSSQNDTLMGDANANTLSGSGGDDALVGLGGADVLNGGIGNDWMDGGAGVDSYDGGADNDTISFLSAAAGVTVFLFQGTDQVVDDGFGNTETAAGIEWVVGSDFGDTIVGDAQANVLQGMDGNDNFFAGLGNDFIMGGSGNDFLQGDEGFDAFAFDVSDFQSGVFDTISDFSESGTSFDVLYLTGLTMGDLTIADFNGNVFVYTTGALDTGIVINGFTAAQLADQLVFA